MGIGLGVVLLLLGLILAFDVIDLPASIDDVVATNTLGWILIIVGALAIVLALVMNNQRTRRTGSSRSGASTHLSERHSSQHLRRPVRPSDIVSGGRRAAVRCPP